MAATMASTMTTTELPWMIASSTARPRVRRSPGGWPPSPGGTLGGWPPSVRPDCAGASAAGAGSVTGLPVLVGGPGLPGGFRPRGFLSGFLSGSLGFPGGFRARGLIAGSRFIAGPRAGHQQAKHLHRYSGRPDAGYPPFVHHRDAVGQGVDLVEFGGDDQDRHPLIPFGHDAAVHELDGAHVEAPGRLAGHEQPQFAADLASQDDFLLVAA